MAILTATEIKERFNNDILQYLTDYSKTGEIIDIVIEKAITRAKNSLSSYIDITNSNLYGEERIKEWWADLVYYRLFSVGSRGAVARDKRDDVFLEIEAFKDNRQSEIEEENNNTSDYFFSSEELIDEDDIVEWK